MSDIAEFLRAQYKRIEQRERNKFTVPYLPNFRCPTCDRRVDETNPSSRQDHARFEPCGHTMPIAEYVERYAESAADPFVLADLESKRQILDQYERWSLEKTAALEADGVVVMDAPVEWRMLAQVIRWLAVPFADKPDYLEKWRP